jgi:manganese efflux pump family protein
MTTSAIIIIAFGLAMDAFAVSIISSLTLGRASKRQIFRIAFHFGLFQAFMPVLGWAAGREFESWIAPWDHWVAFVLLAGIGARSIYEAWQDGELREEKKDPSKGLRLVALSTATSIDALAVGITYAALDVEIFFPALVTGLITCVLSVCGMLTGARLGLLFGQGAEFTGGVVLILIGIRILISHLFGAAG